MQYMQGRPYIYICAHNTVWKHRDTSESSKHLKGPYTTDVAVGQSQFQEKVPQSSSLQSHSLFPEHCGALKLIR